MFVLCIGIYIRIASYYVINYDVIIKPALDMYLNASEILLRIIELDQIQIERGSHDHEMDSVQAQNYVDTSIIRIADSMTSRDEI